MSAAQKVPLSRTLSHFTKRKAMDEIEKLGLALPGRVISVSGAIVTVNFEVTGGLPQVTMPVATSAYVRIPIQVGDLGVAVPASVFLGGVSGLAAGTATLSRQLNLSTLFWIPLGSANWSAVDPNAVTIFGPNGVVLRDSNSETVFTLTPTGLVITSTSGQISLSAGGHNLTINSSGVTIDDVVFATHSHLPGSYVAGDVAVTGDSGAVA